MIPPKRAGELARDSLTHVAHGADAVCFFQWRQSAAGGERFHAAMVPHAGEDSRVFRDVVDLGRTLAQASRVTGSVREPAKVAVLFDWESLWVSRRDSHPSDCIRYRDEAISWYSALLDAGVRADVVPADSALDGYDVVVAPMLHVVSPERRERLAEVVENGRHLVVGYFSGIVDANDRVWLGGYPGAFRDVLGVLVEEFVPLRADESVTLASGAVATDWTERIAQVGDDVEVLDSYASGDLAGAPAITRRRVGEGSATYVSARLETGELARLVARLGAEIPALVGDSATAGGALELAVRTNGTERFVFAINRTDEPVTASIGGHVVVGEADAEGRVVVAPRGVAVFAG